MIAVDQAYLDRVGARLRELEGTFSNPATDPSRKGYRALIREHALLKRRAGLVGQYLAARAELAQHRALMADEAEDAELRTLAREEAAGVEARLPAIEKALTVALLPPDPDDERNAIMEIRAGTGGDEAAIFAGDLCRMYGRYAEGRGWKVSLMDASPSTQGGYKEVVFSVEGQGAYGALRYESGVHRVQRVPATEAQGRIHTSTATVAVFPEAEDEDEIDLPADEIRIDVFCSSGAGGQHVNKTASAVRITHLPTGIVATCQDERSQHRNRDKAMNVLRARILDVKRREEAERMGSSRRSQIGSGDRSEKIRTYNFPQNRLTDHRINLTIYTLDRVIDGELGPVVEEVRDRHVQERLTQELAAGAGRGG